MLLTAGAPGSAIGLGVPLTQEPLLMICVTAASSIRLRLLLLLIVTDGCVKFVLPIWTSVLPPPEPPHATTRTVTRASTTKPAISFFIVFASLLSLVRKNVTEQTLFYEVAVRH